jgi:uncharacterized protein YecT (DUF1311 family)
MRRSTTWLTLMLVLVIAGASSRPFAQSQPEMTAKACGDLDKADKQLNDVFQQALKNMEDKDAEKLRVAEKAWLAFRDAELQAAYPGERSSYGSDLPMCECMELAALTRDRIAQLQRSLKGGVCSP